MILLLNLKKITRAKALSDNDENMTIIIKRFKMFMRKNKTNLVRREGKNKSELKKDTVC